MFKQITFLLAPTLFLLVNAAAAVCLAQEASDKSLQQLREEIENVTLQGDFQKALELESGVTNQIEGLEADDYRVIDHRLGKRQLGVLVKLDSENRQAILPSLKSLATTNVSDWRDRNGPALRDAKDHFQRLKKMLGPQQPLTLQAKIRIAEILSTQRRYREAVDLLTTCIPECENLWTRFHPETIDCKRGLAGIYYWLRESQKSVDLIEKCMLDSKQVIEFPQSETIDMLMGAGKAYVALGQFKPAEERYERVKKILEDSDSADSFQYANCLLLIGAMHISNSNPIRAESYLSNALRYFESNKMPGDPFRTTTRNYLASCRYELGDLRTAKRLYQTTLQECKDHLPKNHPSKSNCYHWLGKIAAEQGDFVKQQQYFELSYQMDVEIWGQDHPNVQSSLASLAAIHERDANYEKAEKLYRLALKNQIKGKPTTRILTALNLAKCLVCSAKLEPARKALDQCKQLCEQFDAPDRLLVKLHFHECEFALRTGETAKANEQLALIESRLPKLQRATEFETLKLELLRGEIAVSQQQLENAVVHFKNAITIENNIDRRLGLSASPASLENLKHQQAAFHSYCAAFVDLLESDPGQSANIADLYNQVIQFKGQITERQKLVNAVKRDPEISSHLIQLRKLNSVLAARLSGKAKRDRRSTQTIVRQKNEREQEIAQRLKKRQLLQAVSLERIKAVLRPNEIFLDFINYRKNGTRNLLVFMIQHDAPIEFYPLGDVSAIADDLDAWSDGQGESVAAQKAAIRLRDRLWSPFEKSIASNKEIVISPDGRIGSIPFSALPTKDGRFLIEDHLITYQISAQSLINQRADSPETLAEKPSTQLLLVGAPVFDNSNATDTGVTYVSLPKARSELQKVATLLQSNQPTASVRQLIGKDATVDKLVENAASCTHLHIATHGFWHGSKFNSPENSSDFTFNYGQISGCLAGIVLSPEGEGADESASLLSADDVTYMNLSGVNQVVLSGCNTGSGIWKTGEGTASLQRSFYVGGAKTVVASLWPVPDASTTELMTLYYKNLFEKKMPKANALRQAQIAMLKNTALPTQSVNLQRGQSSTIGSNSPYRWGAFVMSGEKK